LKSGFSQRDVAEEVGVAQSKLKRAVLSNQKGNPIGKEGNRMELVPEEEK